MSQVTPPTVQAPARPPALGCGFEDRDLVPDLTQFQCEGLAQDAAAEHGEGSSALRRHARAISARLSLPARNA